MGYTLVQLPKGGAQPAEQPKKRYRLVQAPPQQEVNAGGKSDRAMSGSDMAMDVLKAGGAGLGRGAIGLATTGNDMREIGGGLTQAGAEALGASPEAAAGAGDTVRMLARKLPGLVFPAFSSLSNGPTSAEATEAVNDLTSSALDYQPKTTAGEYARTAGEFAPAAVAGPGGVMRKIAMGTIPAALSETAGQITKGTEAEPYARLFGGLAGGVAAAGRAPSVTKITSKGAPTREAVKAEADQLYDTLRNAGIKYDSNSYDLMVSNLTRKLRQMGYRAGSQATKGVDDSLSYILEGVGKSPDFGDFEAIRQNAGLLRMSADRREQMFGNAIIEALDDFAGRSPLMTNGSIKSSDAAPLMKQAREVAGRNIRARNVDEAVERARNTASGFENGLRIEFRKILNNKKLRAGYSQTEIEAMKEIVRGTSAQNLAAQFGRLGVGLGTKTAKAAALPAGIGTAGAAGAIDPLIAGSTIALASGAKWLAGQNAERIADRLTKTVLSGSGAQKAALSTKRAEQLKAILRRALGFDAAMSSSRPEINLPAISGWPVQEQQQ